MKFDPDNDYLRILTLVVDRRGYTAEKELDYGL